MVLRKLYKVKSLNCVRLFATPWTVAYQALLSMGFPRQQSWSGLPFPSPGEEFGFHPKGNEKHLWVFNSGSICDVRELTASVVFQELYSFQSYIHVFQSVVSFICGVKQGSRFISVALACTVHVSHFLQDEIQIPM